MLSALKLLKDRNISSRCHVSLGTWSLTAGKARWSLGH